MTRPKTIGPALTELAMDLLDRAKAADVALEIKLDIFKQLTAFHVGTTRVAKHVPEEPDEGSIVSLKDHIARATPKVRRRPADPDEPQRDPERQKGWHGKHLDDATNDLGKLTHPGDIPF